VKRLAPINIWRRRSAAKALVFVAIGMSVITAIWLASFPSPQGPAQTTTSPPESSTIEWIATTASSTERVLTTTYPIAADFTLTDVDGNLFRLSDQRGKIVVLEFIVTTCGACAIQEIYLRELRSSFGSDVVTVTMSVNPSHDSETLLRSHRDESLPGWISVRDTGQINEAYSVEATPTILIIDENGYIRYRHRGITDSTTLIAEVESLMK